MSNNATKSKGLGRGLSSLMGEAVLAEITPVRLNGDTGGARDVMHLPLGQLQPGKYQPRRHFDDAALSELAASITKHGLMQPIVVRMLGVGLYEIIAGERRWRAAQRAALAMVPVILREANDAQALELALIENIQRSDLNPLEEAAGYQRLMDEFGYTQEKLAPMVGKSRSHIANLLRLLKLPEGIKKRIDSGELTMGHARALLMAADPELLAQQIVEIGLSVRQAEERAKGVTPDERNDTVTTVVSLPKQRPQGLRRSGSEKSDDVQQLENMLADSLGLRVSIDTRGAQAGEVIISYDSLSQLDEILRRLGGGM
ncbi:MAG: ParB/RepB/Spo0J family partition protein [Alphaproteobacteria bacterium]|nr:ParB/RepB/Spo0J family partition protein [Alphaproteobacteria bacterium]